MSDRITVTLHELVSAMDSYADDYLRRHHGVGYNLFSVLAALVELAPLDISQLARALRISKAAVSKRVPALVAGGWVLTQPDVGRRIRLSPSESAISLVRDAGARLEAEFASVFVSSADAEGDLSVPLLNARLIALTRLLEQKERP